MDYRALYEQVYGITIPDGFDIHHIDFNHDNNNPNNLVMLPRELHKKLHYYHTEFSHVKTNYTLDDINIYSGHCDNYSYFMIILSDYTDILDQCVVWMNKRDFAKMNKECRLV